MTKLTFKKLGLSPQEIDAEAKAGNAFKEKAAKLWLAMHATPAPDEREIAEFESTIAATLPEDFKNFLKKHNGGRPSLVLLPTRDNERVVESFFALKSPKGFSDSIPHAIEVYRSRIPLGTLPIASAGGGDLLLMNLAPERFGQILYWDHNLESDEDQADDYFDNTELVATSFTELLAKLAPD